ncbi:MAG: alpha-D-glucose phosphate-specific phosphoglucomutase, partial [Verrucomicrobia bacterium]|nr:alpha-D-glucose phosphate-specific phosphoglucomutase [Verrucomicrobiota bacterium]
LSTLGGEPVERLLDRAPGNDQPIGGFKAVTAGGWFAVRPSGTENILKFYAESLKDPEHLSVIMEEAKTTVLRALQA